MNPFLTLLMWPFLAVLAAAGARLLEKVINKMEEKL